MSGAHALGRCHPTASGEYKHHLFVAPPAHCVSHCRFFLPTGYDGPWTPTPTTFNNAYFTLLMNLKWVPKEWDGPYQYVDASTGKLMMLPSYVLCVFPSRTFSSSRSHFFAFFPVLLVIWSCSKTRSFSSTSRSMPRMETSSTRTLLRLSRSWKNLERQDLPPRNGLRRYSVSPGINENADNYLEIVETRNRNTKRALYFIVGEIE